MVLNYVLSTRVGKKWCGEIGYVSQLPSSGFLVQASHEFILKIIYYGTCSVFAFVRVRRAKSQNFLIALFSESLFATFQLPARSSPWFLFHGDTYVLLFSFNDITWWNCFAQFSFRTPFWALSWGVSVYWRLYITLRNNVQLTKNFQMPEKMTINRSDLRRKLSPSMVYAVVVQTNFIFKNSKVSYCLQHIFMEWAYEKGMKNYFTSLKNNILSNSYVIY